MRFAGHMYKLYSLVMCDGQQIEGTDIWIYKSCLPESLLSVLSVTLERLGSGPTFIFFAFECLRTQWSSERVVKLKLGGDACTRSHLCFGSLFSRIGPLMQGLQGSAHVTACSDCFVCTFFINMKYV